MKLSYLFLIFFLLFSFVFISLNAQESTNNKQKISNDKTGIIKKNDETTANYDNVAFYDGSKMLVQFVSSGVGGLIYLPPINNISDGWSESLFNLNGDLYWGFEKLNTSNTGINGLSDGVFDRVTQNLFLGDPNQPISGYSNIGIGNEYTFNNLSTGDYNVIVGMEAFSYNTTGEWNTGIGGNVLWHNTEGSFNSAVGTLALSSNTTGNYNVGLGPGALGENSIGSSNIGIGRSTNGLNQEGSFNTIIGAEAGVGTAIHNKSGNIFLGYQAGYNEMGNNKLYIENSNSASPLIYGDFTDGSEMVKINGKLNVGTFGYTNVAFSSNSTGTNHASYFTSVNGTAIWGSSQFGYAGYFEGPVYSTIGFTGPAASSKIDHPLDPTNKNINLAYLQSPEMMNVYNGNVTLDGSGEATVTMADWFEALNKDFRYQLTAIGTPGPNLYVAEKINGNQFRIAGGVPGMEVSWQVTGVRQDAYANENRIKVEELKKPEERGKYLHPTAFGQSKEMGISYSESMKQQEQ
ncbi:MAG: hypothetical protein KDC88_03995 [Ignavibacteriae bacterium]|nr:hypothetical protein [Ignavibacteriota bacterium]MCB9260180.1 hypothetical protein [Ignavibacteriales bacterium]